MTGISEDQEQELEALQAIYPNELTITNQEVGDVRFSVHLKCEDNESSIIRPRDVTNTTGNNDSDDEDGEDEAEPGAVDDNNFWVDIEFILPEEYPQDVPSILIQDRSRNLLNSDEEELLGLLNQEARNSLGMVMVFTLLQVGLEWLNLRKDEDEARRKQLEERRLREMEEAEQKKFEGTRVTVDSFMKWKLAFDAEMADLKSKQDVEVTNRLTGKELFEKDRTLNESDLQFLEKDKDISYDNAGVKVDTALFDEDDNDFDDDEDYDED